MTLIAEDLLLLLLDDETLAARLVAAGLLERREDRVLGLSPGRGGRSRTSPTRTTYAAASARRWSRD